MINNRYKILHKIGEGRSKVFACEDKYFPNEKIAIKILQYTANDSEIGSFYNEYKIIKSLNHPNIISGFDKGTILKLDDDYKAKFNISENDKFITLERVDGVQFDQCAELQNEADLKVVIKQLSLALQYIHQSNYIYFDLKPENILVYSDSGKLKIKLIDFGLARYSPNLEANYFKGTPEFLAPEILKKEELDYRVDFYSMGILLYHLVYQKYPFRNGSQLEIYRAHIEKDFDFPSCKFSSKIIKIIRKLLAKNPDERYLTSIEIIDELSFILTLDEKINLNSSLAYLDREYSTEKLVDYIDSESWGKICTLKGESGSGKSRLLENLANNSAEIVHIKTNNFISASNFWQQFFSRLLFNEKVFKSVDDSLIQYVSLHIDDNSEDLLVELKTIISKISSHSNFILLIDDFDKFEAHNIELLLQLFPILLANQIKIIVGISDDSFVEFSDKFELETIIIKPFNDFEIKKLIKNSFYKLISHKDFSNLILSFSDRNPAAISNFISQLIITKIVSFENNRIEINYNEDKIAELLTSQNKIFEVIFENLDSTEIKILEVISLFQVEISSRLISEVLKVDFDETQLALHNLRNKSILQSVTQTRNLNYVNEGFKKYIYSKISNIKDLHFISGKVVLESFPDMNILNKIRQFELAERFDFANEIIDSNLNSDNIKNFPQLQKKLLKRKISYKTNELVKTDLIMQLINLEISLANYMVALKLINGLSEQKLNEVQNVLKNKYLGIILIKTGEISDGINLLLKVIDSSLASKNELYLEIASAYIEKNNYSQADIICNEILRSENASTEIIGRAQNLLGISNLYNMSDLNITLAYFKKAHATYTKESNFNRIAGSEVNLGNIQNILGNYSKAEKHWNKALQLNQSIGNVEQEANVLLSTGVFNYEHSNYEKAVNAYIKGGNIFKGLGNKLNYGLISLNLGEVYLEICEYKKSFVAFEMAEKIFIELNNSDELIEVYFLLARLFIIVGNEELVSNYFAKIENIKKENTKREEVLINFTKSFAEFTFNKNGKIEVLIKLMDELFSINEKLIASDLLFIIATNQISLEKYKDAFKTLHHKKIIEISSFNKRYNANRLYLLSKIPIEYQTDKSFTKNFLLQKALVIMRSGSISELTINILTDLVIFFKERGNEIKAEEYALLSKIIVQYILHNNSGAIFNNLKDKKYLEALNSIETILGKKEN